MKLSIGDKVQVSECSGLDSGKIGYIVDKRFYTHKLEKDYDRYLLSKPNWLLVAVTGMHLESTASEYIPMVKNRLIKL